MMNPKITNNLIIAETQGTNVAYDMTCKILYIRVSDGDTVIEDFEIPNVEISALPASFRMAAAQDDINHQDDVD